MSNYLISFRIRGDNLDPVLSSIVDKISDLSIGIVNEGIAVPLATPNKRANGASYVRNHYKKARTGPATLRDKLWNSVSRRSSFTRSELYTTAKEMKASPGALGSTLADWSKRGMIKRTDYGEYQVIG